MSILIRPVITEKLSRIQEESGKVTFEVAQKAKPGSIILCMLADTAERYLSSLLFDDIEEEMSEEELEILNLSNS